MEHFTPVSASIGGVLIGVSATTLWLANGRIAGISGIVGGLWTPRTSDVAWRIAFVLGLIAAPPVYWMAGGKLPQITVSVPWPVIMMAGLVVGFGTRLGGGCTSGHGVCGLARLSQRSLVATGSFMATAIVQLHRASSDRTLTSWLLSLLPLFPACCLASDSPSRK